jgi:hypothetical protein
VEVRKQGELVQQGFSSKATAQEALGINPEEEEIKILLERYKEKPETLAALDQRVAQKLGQIEQQAMQQGDQALAGVAGPAQPGAALQGMGQVAEGGQNGVPFAPPGPGEPGVPAQAPGGLPASIPGQPPGVPPVQQQVPPMGSLVAGMGG